MQADIGVRVFPNSRSREMLQSQSYLHYCPPDPPIDYTVRVKPPSRNPDYRVSQAFVKEQSPKLDHDFDSRTKASPPKRPPRRSTQVADQVLIDRAKQIAQQPRRKRRDTLTESESVLLDLESALDLEEKLPMETSPRPATRGPKHQTSLGSTSGSTATYPSLERVKSIPRNGRPVVNDFVLDDLRSVTSVSDVSSVNDRHRDMVEEMYYKTQKLIESARETYTPAYFTPRYNDPTRPIWKRDLLARQASKAALQKYEENAWEEFNEWKRKFAPHIRLQPRYQFSDRPILN